MQYEESGLHEEEEMKEKTQRTVRGRKREEVGNREQRELSVFPASAFWTAAC